MTTQVGSLSLAVLSEVEAAFVQRTPGSRRLHEQSRRLLPGGINRQIAYHQPYPLFAERGEGAWLYDVDGNAYLDALGNFTSLVLGHCHPRIAAAVAEQMVCGTAWAAGSALEHELAALIVERLPSVEQLRFTSSGTEATMMAVRAARAHTGRSLVAKFEGAYHGLHDYAMVSLNTPTNWLAHGAEPRAFAPPGIPDQVRDTVVVLPFNDLDTVTRIVERHCTELAALLVEPVMGVAGVIPPRQGFLKGLRELTADHGILLVFDEVISFRLAYGGAQEAFGITPDLTALGKIIGGGFPVGAVGGREDVMRVFDPSTGPTVLLSGTYHANPVTLRAGIATLRELTPTTVERLNNHGRLLHDGVTEVLRTAARPVRATGIASLFNIHFTDEDVVDYPSSVRADKELLRWLHLALLVEGVMIAARGMGCLSTPMGEGERNFLLEGLERALARLGLR